MPFHWYFTSALPRALLGGYPLAALGYLLERRVRPYVQLVTLYVALYSFLPHKEVQSTCLLCLTVLSSPAAGSRNHGTARLHCKNNDSTSEQPQASFPRAICAL